MRAGWWSPTAQARLRWVLNAALVLLILATFINWADPDVMLDALWVVLAVGAFVFGFRMTVVRIGIVLAIKVIYLTWSASSQGRPLDLEVVELTEWPLVVTISLIVALMADRVSGLAGRYAALYRQASERLVTAHEEERARLARDLHDGVGQTLTAALLTIDAAGAALSGGPPGAGQPTPTAAAQVAIGRARTLVGAALDEARDVAAQLRPLRIHEIGLGAALKKLAASAGAPVDARFQARTLPAGVMEPERQIDTYRIVQEAVSNATRHSRAAHIWIKLKVHVPDLVIEVGDDGVGFKRPAVPVGLGLPGMEERAAILGGRLTIRTEEGTGTTVTLVVPLSDQRLVVDQPPRVVQSAEAVT